MDDEKEELSTYDSLQLIALQDYIYPDENSFFRKLCRWFSATFHTSILEVEKQPFEYILKHYLEWSLENLSKQDFEKHKRFILKKEEVVEEEEDDDAFAEEMELKYLKDQQAKLDKEKAEAQAESPPDIKLNF